MNRRPLMWLAGAVAAVAVVSSSSMSAPRARRQAGRRRVKAAPAKKFATPRTPWGDPDLMGVWDYKTITPLERPQNMAGRALLTDEEVTQARRRGGEESRFAAGRKHAGRHGARAVHDRPRPQGARRPADVAHHRSGRRPSSAADRRRRRPAPACGAAAATAARTVPRAAAPPNGASPTDFRSATLPTLYNNNIRILQGPGYVAITHEMIHETRIIPLDGRQPAGAEDSAVVRRLARPLGRRHARRRVAELLRQDQLPRLGQDAAHHRALHAHRQGSRSTSGSPSTIRTPSCGRGRSRCR